MIKQDYNVLAGDGTSVQDVLRMSEGGSPMQSYYQSSMKDNPNAWVPNADDGLKRLQEEEKTLFFAGDLLVLGNKDFIVLDTIDAVPSYCAWAFQQNSEFTAFFNYHILNIYENGVWARILHV